MENEKTKVLKYNIQNEDLVALGFPQAVASNTHYWIRNYDEDFEIIRDFYNSLYTLTKLYEKYTSKKLKLSEKSYTVFLNGKEVFSCYASHQYFYKHQDLKKIKEIINELLLTKFNSFEELQQEFAEVYEKEKAKSELNEIEIYNWGARLPTGDEQEECEKRKNLFIEALKNEKELAEKETFFIEKPQLFGKRYSIKEKSELKLGKVLDYSGIISIQIYRNLLVIDTLEREPYTRVAKLSKTERQKVLNILTLLKL